MKNSNVIRLLSIISFLIFLCPFFQMCSDKDLPVPEAAETTVEVSDGSLISENEKTEVSLPVIEKTEAQKQLDLEESRKEYTNNGYEMGFYIFKSEPFEVGDLSDPALCPFLCFTMILASSILIVISIFRSRLKTVLWLSVTNLILSFIAIAIFYGIGNIEDISQIKFGYYLFLANTIAITLEANKNLKTEIL